MPQWFKGTSAPLFSREEERWPEARLRASPVPLLAFLVGVGWRKGKGLGGGVRERGREEGGGSGGHGLKVNVPENMRKNTCLQQSLIIVILSSLNT